MSGPRLRALVARLEKGHQKSLEIFQRLTAEQWQQVIYTQPYPWTARDLLAHFVSAEEALLQLAQDVAEGGSGAPPDFDYQDYNTKEHKRLLGRTPQDLLVDLSSARQATLDWVSTLAEETLDRQGRHPALGDISLETMITAIYGHQLLHMRDLTRAMDIQANDTRSGQVVARKE